MRPIATDFARST